MSRAARGSVGIANRQTETRTRIQQSAIAIVQRHERPPAMCVAKPGDDSAVKRRAICLNWVKLRVERRQFAPWQVDLITKRRERLGGIDQSIQVLRQTAGNEHLTLCRQTIFAITDRQT